MKGIQQAIAVGAAAIGCQPDMVRAVAVVESSLGRSLRRFEPHLFRRETGQTVTTFAKAESIDAEVAARCCSIGVFQVLGRWHRELGYKTAQAMMRVLMDASNGDAQGRAIAAYCTNVAPAAGSALRSRDLKAFALSYNGPRALDRGYDAKLRRALAKGGDVGAIVLRNGSTGEAVRRLQQILVGEYGQGDIIVDGWFGRDTEDAVRRVQQQLGLKADGIVGDVTWQALDAGNEEFARDEGPGAFGELIDTIRVAPRRAIAAFVTLSAILGDIGFEGGAAFFEALARGDWGHVGSTVLAYGPFALALAGIVLAGWIFTLAIKEYRHERTFQRAIPDDPGDVIDDPGIGTETFTWGSDDEFPGIDPRGRRRDLDDDPRIRTPGHDRSEGRPVLDRGNGGAGRSDGRLRNAAQLVDIARARLNRGAA